MQTCPECGYLKFQIIKYEETAIDGEINDDGTFNYAFFASLESLGNEVLNDPRYPTRIICWGCGKTWQMKDSKLIPF